MLVLSVKFVVSTTLDSVGWANSTLLGEDVVDQVGRLKARPGRELQVHGSGPGPRDPGGLVGELRARDWIAADGEVTQAGRHALRRWLEADRSS